MKIITQQLADKLSSCHKLLSNQVINPQDYITTHSILINAQELTIYDITNSKNIPTKKFLV